jgi:hypothetical protein
MSPGGRRRIAAVLGALVALLAACTSGGTETGDGTTTTTRIELQGSIELDAAPEDGCDGLQARHCYLPFPSDAYTISGATPTGRRVAFREDQMPRNADGIKIDPTDWNRNDGFSPGTPIMVWVPQIDLAASSVAPITDIGHSLTDESAIVIIDAETGERHPHWAELDRAATSDLTRTLIVRPATNLQEGHRYIVAMRHLVDRGGETIRPEQVFKAYRDRLDTGNDLVEERRPHMEDILATLEDAGVPRQDLWIAWDFTVASTESLTAPMLHIRDDAFADLGDAAPTFEVTSVDEPTDPAEAERVARYVHGTFQVPLYLTGEGGPGSLFIRDDDGMPMRNAQTPNYTAGFTCTVPRPLVEPGADPGHPVVYGHGLFGSRDEVTAGNIQRMTSEHGFVYCATDWIGMSEADLANAVVILSNLSSFSTLADRVQQGILDTLFLGRLLVHEDGFAGDEAFQVDGRPVFEPAGLVFDGNSQGGIIGGAATAVAQDWERAVLGVPGMNYSTLLHRSTDFETYAAVLYPAYPDELERSLAIAMIQMLWDRAEANGYANHMTDDPLPDTPAHRVLMHVAFGDFQVADVAAMVEARTIGARYHDPLLGPDRAFIDYGFGLEPIERYPYEGSAVVMWDSAVPSPPLANVPPTGASDPQGAHDPHEDPRSMATAREQKAAFFLDGVVIDVCDGGPCLADRRP